MIIKDWSIQFAKEHSVTFHVKDNKALVNQAEAWAISANNGKELELIVREVKQKRSLSQNAYFWVMVSKLADYMRLPKQDMYLMMLERYGQREPVTFAVISKAFDVLQRTTDGYAIKVGERTHGNTTYYDVQVLRGSSTYDSKEMSILIDGVMSECHDVNIETMSKAEISLLKLN